MASLIASALVLSLMPHRLYGLKAGQACLSSSEHCHVKWCQEDDCGIKSTADGVQDLCGIRESTSHAFSTVMNKAKLDNVGSPKHIWVSEACAEIRLVSVTKQTIDSPRFKGYETGVWGNLTTHDWKLKCGHRTGGCSTKLPTNIRDGHDETKYFYAIESKAGAKECQQGSCKYNVCMDDVKKVLCTEISYVESKCDKDGEAHHVNEQWTGYMMTGIGYSGPGTLWVSAGSEVTFSFHDSQVDTKKCLDDDGCFHALTAWKVFQSFACNP